MKRLTATSLMLLLSSAAMAAAPAAPTGAGAYNFTDSSARISFKDMADNEQGFKIYQFAPTDAGVIATVDAKDGSGTYQYANLTGLNPSTLYGINIVAYNADGESSTLTKWFRTITPPPTPAAPSNVGVYSETETTVRMSLLDNSDDESGFKVYHNGAVLATLPAKAGSGEYVYTDLTGLAQCALYTVDVVAYNAHGDSDKAEKSFMTAGCMTAEEIPLAPSQVAVYNITSDSARVSFMDNSNNEAIVDGFRVYNNDDNSTMASLGRDRYPNEYQYTNLTGLTPDTLYTIRVVSRNAAGEASADLKTFRTLP